jgi:dTDP-4-amino-4,6-dideoxygalactose transaminase
MAFARTGAELLFCDIDAHTLALDPEKLEALLEPRVKAVIVVHYGGHAADIRRIQSILCSTPDVSLIEDNALGIFGATEGMPLGSFGRFSTLSFHTTKTISCGEGGALLVNNIDDIDNSQIVLEKGTNRREFESGKVDKYTWVGLGSSFGMSDLLAAALLGQLESRKVITGLRQHVWNRYHSLLSAHSERLGIILPPQLPEGEQSFPMYYVLLPDRSTRDQTLRHLKRSGVQAAFHYMPLHNSPAGIAYSSSPAHCPISDDISSRILRLPFYNLINDDQIDYVVETLLDALN